MSYVLFSLYIIGCDWCCALCSSDVRRVLQHIGSYITAHELRSLSSSIT